jgi:abhydrolase domain-containing protein 12
MSTNLVVIKDNSTQTNLSFIGKRKTNAFLIIKWFIILFFCFYCGIVLSTAFSQNIQSMIVYLHIFRWPIGSLTDLKRFGLLQQTRNINITTQDGFVLKGYHIMPLKETADITNINNIENGNLIPTSNDERELFFDKKLASSKRIFVYFHGNAGTRSLSPRIATLKQLSDQLDSHVITFDYRGFGDSEGWPSEIGKLKINKENKNFNVQ